MRVKFKLNLCKMVGKVLYLSIALATRLTTGRIHYHASAHRFFRHISPTQIRFLIILSLKAHEEVNKGNWLVTAQAADFALKPVPGNSFNLKFLWPSKLLAKSVPFFLVSFLKTIQFTYHLLTRN